MTEIKASSFGSLGLFATKSFDKGDLILEELPLVVVQPLDDSESKSLLQDFVGSKKKSNGRDERVDGSPETLFEAIQPPASVPPACKGTFRGLVQAGLCWMKRQPVDISQAQQDSLLELYYPKDDSSSEHEKVVLQVADEAVEYLKRNKPESFATFKDWETLRKVMLIWACNAFQGGRIYPQLSRVNHDCDPNAVIQAREETQRLVAACAIACGDEIKISYLGLLLYSDTNVRKAWLQKSKFFDCQCKRCSTLEDKAARLPCPNCHPRHPTQQSLDEDVQYDDDQTVQYTTLQTTCSKCSSDIPLDGKLAQVITNVLKKVTHFLDTFESRTGSDAKDTGGDDEEDLLEDHATLASTIMGDKHWATNLLMMLLLDGRLSTMTQSMLTTQELPEFDDIAECIDRLERVCRFVDDLELDLDAGHMLGDVVIGVARLLVSLGDVKSQKYGAEWLGKIQDYVDKFESDGRQKVVQALAVAWKTHCVDEDRNRDPVENHSSNKKQKTKE